LRLDGSDVECALDRGQIVALKRHVPICELELELKAGSPPPLISLARKLNKAARLHVETQSKAARGYELMIQNPPAFPRAKFAELDEATIAQSAFAEIARACTGYVLACASYARRNDDPEGIHELRVAIAFTTSVTHTRARGALREQTDPHQPPGRRCGCWPTSPFLFSFPSGLAGPAADET
jgi:inorganic triphosphatase YgiF